MKYFTSLFVFMLMVGMALPTAHGQLLATTDGANGTASYYHEGYHGSTTASGELEIHILAPLSW